VANDGQNEADAGAISQAAATLGLRGEPIPLPERNNPSDGLAAAMDFLVAAGWHPDDVRNERAKQEWFTALCDRLLTGGLTLQQTSAPAVAPWPADMR
jgi:hypothetical protein